MKIKGKSVTGGMAERDAIVTHMLISFTGGVDPDSGIIRKPNILPIV